MRKGGTLFADKEPGRKVFWLIISLGAKGMHHPGGSIMRKIRLRLWLAVMGLALASSRASADTVSVSVDSSNLSFTGPYGTVTVDRTDSTHATIKFESSVVGGNIYLFGDVAVNVNASTFKVSGLTESNSGTGFSAPTLSIEQPAGGTKLGNLDNFNLLIAHDKGNGFANAVDTVSFTVENTSGTWSTAFDVLGPFTFTDGKKTIQNNAVAGAHIFVTASPADESNGSPASGFGSGTTETGGTTTGGSTTGGSTTGGGGGTLTPEPSSFVLMGIGVLGIAGFSWRRLRRGQPAIA